MRSESSNVLTFAQHTHTKSLPHTVDIYLVSEKKRKSRENRSSEWEILSSLILFNKREKEKKTPERIFPPRRQNKDYLSKTVAASWEKKLSPPLARETAEKPSGNRSTRKTRSMAKALWENGCSQIQAQITMDTRASYTVTTKTEIRRLSILDDTLRRQASSDATGKRL